MVWRNLGSKGRTGKQPQLGKATHHRSWMPETASVCNPDVSRKLFQQQGVVQLLQVTMLDFLAALDEVQPAFGANTENLAKNITHGVVDYGDAYRHLASTLRTLVSQVTAGCGHCYCIPL